MAENTHIEWTDHTFNPWEGCQKVAPECDNCYAETRNNRFHGGANWGPKAPRRRTSDQNWNKPRKWNRQADAFFAEHGRRQRVFCASLADVFDNAVDPAWRADLFDLIRECDGLDWLLLTKRPQNIANMLPDDWGTGWPHVWLGTSAGTQKTADTNIPHLLATPAAVRFVSAEPLLERVDFTNLRDNGYSSIDALREYPAFQAHDDWGDEAEDMGPFADQPAIDWVICGGESGPNARPMHPDWARSLRDQCQSAGTAFFFKQWGEYADHTDLHSNCQTCRAASDLIVTPEGHTIGGGSKRYGGMVDENWQERRAAWMCCVGKSAAGRVLNGQKWDEFPASPLSLGSKANLPDGKRALSDERTQT